MILILKGIKMDKKIKILWYGDSPTCATGFAQVTRNVLKELHKTGKFDIDILGINFDGFPYDRTIYPYNIHPATSAIVDKYNDLMGRVKLLDMLDKGNYDLVFMLQDTFNMLPIMEKLLKIQEKRKFVLLFYFVIDVMTPKREWITQVVSKINYPISCTQYAKDVCMKIDPELKRMSVIEYGVDTSVFKPLPKEEIDLFKLTAFKNMDSKIKTSPYLNNKYIVLNVNRNQIRKDYLATFEAFKLFKEKVPDAFLFCLCAMSDQGGDIRALGEYFGLDYGKDWISPINYTPGNGFPLEIINMIYNISDMGISTSAGEGYGLSSVEFMATKKPLVFPKNTSFLEIIGEDENRGYLVPTKGYLFFGHNDNNMIRPKIDIAEMVSTMLYCYQNKEETQKKVEVAYQWVLTQTWESKVQKWMDVIGKALFKLEQIRK